MPHGQTEICLKIAEMPLVSRTNASRDKTSRLARFFIDFENRVLVYPAACDAHTAAHSSSHMSLSAPGVARGARAHARVSAPRDAARGVRHAAFARARDRPAAARTAAPPSGLVAWSSARSGVVARAELKSGGEGRYVRPVEDKSPMKDEEIYFDPADLDDDDDASFAFDDDDDEDDDDDDSWFFVPEGAVAGPVTDKAIDLFNIDDDDDDADDDDRRRRRRRRRPTTDNDDGDD